MILRHDSSHIKPELYAFFLRTFGLVMIISIFVTIGTWVTLGHIIVTPILKLRNDLAKAGEAISNGHETPKFYSTSVQRPDELGEVTAAFRRMYHPISNAIGKRRKAEEALQESLRQVEAYSEKLNKELESGRQMQINFLPSQLMHIAG